MGETRISWTNYTANFWLGCMKVSGGCRSCYAETLTRDRMNLHVFGPDARRVEVRTVWTNLRKWDREAERLGERKKVFIMSLGDFFEDRPELMDVRVRAWEAMRATNWLDFQILTKRPENIRKFLPRDWPWPNVWLGVSIEDDAHVFRADLLREIPASVRFISYEPAIGPVPSLNLEGISWTICGGESGPGYRALDHAWARDVRDRCVQAGIAFFMKQDAAPRTEMRTYLLEADGSRWLWKQYPGQLNPPIALDV